MKKYSFIAMMLVCSMLAACGSSKRLVPPEISSEVPNSVVQGSEVPAEQPDAEPVDDETALWEFSKRMLSENIEDNNPVLSPASAYLAMGMVGLGAEGETLKEFQNVMGVELQTTAADMMSAIPSWINAELAKQYEKDSKLLVANSVWVDEAMHPAAEWLQGVTDIYQAETYQGLLSGEGVMKDINHWVDKKTNSLIRDFLSESLPEGTRLALFNTIYFKGEWQSKFEALRTRQADFTTESGTVQTDMMQDYGRHEFYLSNDRMDGVVMDYRYGSMAMVALKPTAGQSVRELFEELTFEEINGLLDAGENHLINLKFPKFEVEFDKALNDTLINMGLKRAFDAELAEFGRLGTTDSGYPLYIDLVRQKAVVIVDEEGTEAAAVTEVIMVEGAAVEGPEPPLDVFFDEPFFYMLMDMESRTPLFMGILDNPVE